MSRLHIFPVAVLASSIVMLPGLAADTDASAPDQPYQLKNRSTFTAPEVSRPPFWPIGFVKRAKIAGEVHVAPTPTAKLTPEMFAVTSILVGHPSLAVINGRAYGEGELLRGSKSAADPRARIRVMRIADGQVHLQSGDGQTVVVALRRPELSERKAEEPVLSDER
ncbi:hypothetical protein ACXR0O_02270 [Verrucomicrobiota bacterium sgz303538]